MGRGGKRAGAGRKPKSKRAANPLTAREELAALLRKQFPGDDRERTYLQLLLEGQARAAIKGNVEAAKFLLRHAALGSGGGPKERNLPNLKHLRGGVAN
jgi:hypothetical protein